MQWVDNDDDDSDDADDDVDDDANEDDGSDGNNESGNADVAMMPTTRKSVIDANDHNDGDNEYYGDDNDDMLMTMTVTINKKGKKS